MPYSLAIGDFSRASHLTVKTLRHYHETGLLKPAQIDPQTGYRRYTTEQIPVAQIIKRFRDLDMPLNEIRAVLSAPDVQARNDLIAAHLKRLENDLARTRTAVASLRKLLEHPAPAVDIGRRRTEQVTAAAISEVVHVKDALSWYLGALGELHAALSAQRVNPTGSAGGIFSNAIFSHAHGEATVFIPCGDKVRAIRRVSPRVVPAVELATLVHKARTPTSILPTAPWQRTSRSMPSPSKGPCANTIWWDPRTPPMRAPGVLRLDGPSFKRADWKRSVTRR
jgi:DNA-binding transcriptional MerR regulator